MESEYPVVKVAASPGRSPLHGNLTGIGRKVKDSCVDWHNYVEKWKSLSHKGYNLLSEIANVKLEVILSSQHDGEVENHPLPNSLHELSAKLAQIFKSLEQVVLKFETITGCLKGVADLEWFQQNELFCETPLFQTWITPVFGETSEELLRMYQKELQLKKTIMENVCHATSRDLVMTYCACWLHEPYLDDQVHLLLASMLKEVGLT